MLQIKIEKEMIVKHQNYMSDCKIEQTIISQLKRLFLEIRKYI